MGSMSRDVHSCSHWLRPHNPPSPRIKAHKTRGAIGQLRLTTSPCKPLVRVLLGENWAISLLTLTLKIQAKSQHTTSKPTSILLQETSSPRQQAKQCKQCIRLLMSSYCTIKTVSFPTTFGDCGCSSLGMELLPTWRLASGSPWF